MKYDGRAFGRDLTLSIEDEGIRIGDRFLDYADVGSMSPVNHRVIIDTIPGEQIEISMLGFSFDGFWEELTDRFGKRSIKALFVEEEQIMLVDGEYQLPAEEGDQIQVTAEASRYAAYGEPGQGQPRTVEVQRYGAYGEPGQGQFGTATVEEQRYAAYGEPGQGQPGMDGAGIAGLNDGGKHHIAGGRGRAKIALYTDSVCILPETRRAVRIPLCFADEIRRDGFQMHIRIRSGEEFVVGKMGYDTEAFYERMLNAEDTVKKMRREAIEKVPDTFSETLAKASGNGSNDDLGNTFDNAPDDTSGNATDDAGGSCLSSDSGNAYPEYASEAGKDVTEVSAAECGMTASDDLRTEKGIFRTENPEQYWNAVIGKGVAALELFTGDDAATYLYRFSESEEEFRIMLEEALEAMATHREIIYLSEEELAGKPLYRMARDRMKAVRYLRARSAGRIIHNAAHGRKLAEFLQSGGDM